MRKNLIFVFSCLLFWNSCTKDKLDPYGWIDNYTGKFRFIKKVTGHHSDGFSTAGNGPYSYSDTTVNTISRVSGNEILLNGWTVHVDQNKKFSFSSDTSYGANNHISSKKNMSGEFSDINNVNYTFIVDNSNGYNATSDSQSGEVFGAKIK